MIAPTEAVGSYFSTHAHAVLVCAFLQLGAAILFGIFAATVASRLQFLGGKAAGASIAIFWKCHGRDGRTELRAVISMIGKSLVAQNPAPVQAIHYLAVALAGPGFTMPFGLLMAALSVTAGFLRLLPK